MNLGKIALGGWLVLIGVVITLVVIIYSLVAKPTLLLIAGPMIIFLGILLIARNVR